jgi:hypothetical protein
VGADPDELRQRLESAREAFHHRHRAPAQPAQGRGDRRRASKSIGEGLLATGPTPEKKREAERIKAVLKTGLGDAEKGKIQFMARCFICHKLFNEGGTIGPDLTGYDRSNADFWLDNLFTPSLEIREGFGAYIVKTKNGQILTGLMDAQDGKAS